VIIYDYVIELRYPDSYNPRDPAAGITHTHASGHIELLSPVPMEDLRGFLAIEIARHHVGQVVEVVQCEITRRTEETA
ncbi:hypothetical protein JYK22_12250, partial [Nonomuraea sp. RK-328]|nr:hypothetical protein [Nonomuraea sp. RK-328]